MMSLISIVSLIQIQERGIFNMAELSDITSRDAVKKQMEDYSTMYEMQADYIQDLKHHLESLDSSEYADQIEALNVAQRFLYGASMAMLNGENPSIAKQSLNRLLNI